MTINLENRKEIDFSLITNATKKKSRTFTELLHVTKLPRKTLSFRLKELCAAGVIVKKEGVYEANGVSQFADEAGKPVEKFSKMFHDRRLKTGLMFIALLISFSVSGYVLAMFFIPQESEPHQEPVIIGEFKVSLNINNVRALYTWQVVITFNPTELKVMKTISGDFFDVEYPFFVNATDIGEGILLLGGTLSGDAQGKSGSGRLATIVFGYFTSECGKPRLVQTVRCYETFLLDSHGSIIPINDSTLTLNINEN